MPSPARPGSPPINQMVPSLPGGSVPRAPPGMRRTDESQNFRSFTQRHGIIARATGGDTSAAQDCCKQPQGRPLGRCSCREPGGRTARPAR